MPLQSYLSETIESRCDMYSQMTGKLKPPAPGIQEARTRKETAHGTAAPLCCTSRIHRARHDVQDVQEEAEPGRGDGRAAEPLPGEPARVGAGFERAPVLPDRAVLLVLRGLLRRPVRASAARQAQRLRAPDVHALPAAAAACAPLRRAVPGLQDVPAPGARGGLHPAQLGTH